MPELPTDLTADAPRDRRAGRLVGGLPRWVALPAAAGLIALVALASRSASAPPVSVSIDTSPLVGALQVAGYVAEFLGLAGLLAAMIFYRAKTMRAQAAAGSKRRPPPMPWWAQAIGLAAVIGIVVGQCLIIVAYVMELIRALRAGGGAGVGGSLNPLDLSPGLAARDATSLLVALVITVGLLGALIVAAIRWRIQDRRFATDGPSDHRTATEAAVDVSLEALRQEADPRRAVIAAYAAMERSLSDAGLGRHRSEAPLEYLRRVLTERTDAPDEVRTITDLFQVAKFSEHTVDEDMRTDAIEALEHIRAATGPR